jgi:predicted amidohydrolase YtcJ
MIVSLSGWLATALAIAFAAAPVGASQQAPDLVLLGGKVFTSDTARPWAEAVAIRGERIVAVGTTSDLRRLAGPSSRVIDVGGRVVVPGFNDAHDHILAGSPGTNVSMGGPAVDAAGDQVLDSVHAVTGRVARGTWIRVEIWAKAFNDTTLGRPALDREAPAHPVVIYTGWGHGMIVNTVAMRALGIRDTEPDPIGGWYERERHGRLTGRLYEYAGWSARRRHRALVPESTMVETLRRFARSELRLGITTVHDMGLNYAPATQVRVLRAAQLPLRVHVYKHSIPTPSSLNIAEWDGLPERPAPLVVVSGRKWILDGAPPDVDGLMFTRGPQAGRPGWHGRFNFPIDSVRRMLAGAIQRREQLALHALGDSAVAIVVRLMETVAPDSVWRPLRLRFEHGGILGTPDLWARAAAKGVVIVGNLPFIPDARTLPKAFLDSLAGDFRPEVVSLFPLGLGSDGVARSPFAGLANALRFPYDPVPSREFLVRAYTWGSAYAELAESQKGTLAPGMLADIAVLSQDIFTVPAEVLPRTESVLTLVGGRIAWDAGVVR